jgi:hypothetical protein
MIRDTTEDVMRRWTGGQRLHATPYKEGRSRFPAPIKVMIDRNTQYIAKYFLFNTIYCVFN